MDAHGHDRVRRAGWRVWQQDVATRPAGAWCQLDELVLHATGLPHGPWNGAHLLGGRGLDPVTELPVMARPLEALPPLPRAHLRWDDVEGAAAVQADAFGDPLDLDRAFLHPKVVNPASAVVTAYLDGVPASTATVVVADGVAGVYGVGTVEAARRQGLGAAVTLAVLHEAVRRGCDLAFLNPTSSGYRLYEGLGFTDAVGWRVWADPELSAPAP